MMHTKVLRKAGESIVNLQGKGEQDQNKVQQSSATGSKATGNDLVLVPAARVCALSTTDLYPLIFGYWLCRPIV